MDDTQRQLNAAIQEHTAHRQEMLKSLDEIDKRLASYINELDAKIDRIEKVLTQNIYDLDKRLTYLETNTITRKEFSTLEARIDKIERSLRSI